MEEEWVGEADTTMNTPKGIDRQPETSLPPDEELQVIRMIASGAKDLTIARKVGVSVVTVRRRVHSFRRRIGVESRAEAIAIAALRGWLDDEGFLIKTDSQPEIIKGTTS